MIKFRIKLDLELSRREMSEIAALKSKRWEKYSENEPLKWYKKNRKDEDQHILLYDDDQLVGYATAKNNIVLTLGEKKYKAIGVASVCTSESGKGYGLKLLNIINEIIERKSTLGFLLTSDKNCAYYNKKGWEIINVVFSKELKTDNIIGMILDIQNKLNKESIEFNDELF